MEKFLRPVLIAYSLPELVIPMRPMWVVAAMVFAATGVWLGIRPIRPGKVVLMASLAAVCLALAARASEQSLSLAELPFTSFGVAMAAGLVAAGWAVRHSAATVGQDEARALTCFICSVGLGLVAAQSPLLAEGLYTPRQPVRAEWSLFLGVAVASAVPVVFFHREGLRGRQWLDAASPCAMALGSILHLSTFLAYEVAPSAPVPLYLAGGSWLIGRLLLWLGPRRRFFGQTFLVAAMTYPGIEYALVQLQGPIHGETHTVPEITPVAASLLLAVVLWRHWSASPLPPRTT